MDLFLNLLSQNTEGDVIDRLQAYAGTADKSIAQQQIADPDYWGSVGIITLTGILVVFLILAILIFFFWLLGTIFKGVDKALKNKAEAKKKAAEAAVVKPVVAEPQPVAEEVDYTDDEEIVAVISAAIAAYTEQGFTIKSIRKRNTRVRSAWSTAGITENTRPF